MAAFAEYPRHVHKAGGAFLVVEDDAQKAAALAEGWALSPDLASAQINPVLERRKPGRPRKVADED